jgi:hypothetical protein
MTEHNKEAISNRKSKNGPLSKIALSLLLGLLSMFYAEVFSGASQLWFIDIWGLFITFPLYMFHSLFYLNCAFKWKRISLLHLYLWGCLFALYEGPITKVLWYGYLDSEGSMFGVDGIIAIYEFLTLVFFWHPIFSFVLPVLITEVFIFSFIGKIDSIEASHLPMLKNTKGPKIVFLLLTIWGSLNISGAIEFNPLIAPLCIAGSVALILIVILILNFIKEKESLTISQLNYNYIGFFIVVFYLIILYTKTSLYIFPERFGNWLGMMIYFLFIAFFLVLLYKTGSVKENKRKQMELNTPQGEDLSNHIISPKFIYLTWVLAIILSMLWFLIAFIGYFIFLGLFLSMPFVGIIFFIYFMLKFRK